MNKLADSCFIFVLFVAFVAHAEIPTSYKPLIIEPPFAFSEKIIDITPALNKAKAEKKPLLLYVGAHDCPPCKEYGKFLTINQAELIPAFDQFTVADIRTWLKGPKAVFVVNGQKYHFASKEFDGLRSFNEFVGDTNKPVYPSWWILSHEGKQLKQLPQGAKAFMDVERHKALLDNYERK